MSEERFRQPMKRGTQVRHRLTSAEVVGCGRAFTGLKEHCWTSRQWQPVQVRVRPAIAEVVD